MTQTILPEVIVNEFNSCDGGFDLTEDEIDSFSGKYRAIVAGSGWGRGESQKRSIELLLKKWSGFLLFDADALNNCSIDELKNHKGSKLIITPHIGEMARLVGKPISEIQANPIAEALSVAKELSAVVVLKSAITIIAEPEGKFFVCSRPNSGLARGGSGDLLAGLIGGLMTVTGDCLRSCIAGVFLHAEAGEMARVELGEDAMTISEVASFIPKAFQKLRS
jgi:NAD(P)H-hydrate epimerase